LLSDVPDPAARRRAGKLAYLQEVRARWAARFPEALLRCSVTANLVWKLGDRPRAAEVASLEAARRSSGRDGRPYRARGPRNPFRDDRGMYEQLVADWERGSLLIDKVCRAHGIRYYHFLQPNQYVPGSKVLSASEREVAFLDGYTARPCIEQGYPLLRQAGRRLAGRGVHFHDLSMVFARNEETFYYDACCHMNRAGAEVLAVPIAQAILQTREPPRAPDPHPGPRPAPPLFNSARDSDGRRTPPVTGRTDP
jgi:hypothetical protein